VVLNFIHAPTVMCFIFSWQKLLGKEKETCIANTILNIVAGKG